MTHCLDAFGQKIISYQFISFLKRQEEIVIYIIYNINKALKSYYQSQKNN